MKDVRPVRFTNRAASAAGSSAADSSRAGSFVSLPRRTLPLAILYLTERCSSRCRSCDWWRHGRIDLPLGAVQRLIPELVALETRVVLLSGGEPLQNPAWKEISLALREAGMGLWLLTSGLSLANCVADAAALFQAITVSLDGADRETYRGLRGVDAFDHVCAGIRAAAGAGCTVTLRCTVQKGNYRQMPDIVRLAKSLGARQVSFLAVDVSARDAFGRAEVFRNDLAPDASDLPAFAQLLDEMELRFQPEFQSGFIAEPPQKLRRLHQYFSALAGAGAFPPVRCNAPEFSAVVEADGKLRPCFFIRGPAGAVTGAVTGTVTAASLEAVLNGSGFAAIRQAVRDHTKPECERCVCSIWRDPEQLAVLRDALGAVRPSVSPAGRGPRAAA